MDPITTAVLAALTAGIAGGAAKVGKKSVIEAYDALKLVIKKKYGNNSKIVKAVNDLENEPKFDPYRDGLQQRVREVKANQDKEVLKAAQRLLNLVESQPSESRAIQHIQTIDGDYNAVAGVGGQATVNVGQSRKSK